MKDAIDILRRETPGVQVFAGFQLSCYRQTLTLLFTNTHRRYHLALVSEAQNQVLVNEPLGHAAMLTQTERQEPLAAIAAFVLTTDWSSVEVGPTFAVEHFVEDYRATHRSAGPVTELVRNLKENN